MRVSMTGDPVEEVLVARRILEAVGERRALVRMISCPTCGRTDPDIDILILTREADRLCNERFADRLAGTGRSITVAVMGCEVNGPGEAAEADFGLAGARGGSMILFARGEKIRKIPMGEAVDALLSEIEKSL
jgi:(E)-4-hydroxy-3-methylbut-2-enyl-diphosphate synthase